jgi:hypothetical protein
MRNTVERPSESRPLSTGMINRFWTCNSTGELLIGFEGAGGLNDIHDRIGGAEWRRVDNDGCTIFL